MSLLISVHSFRGGTGKSNTTANLATLIAATGKRVGIIDTDIQSPGIHTLFGLNESRIEASLNDFLWDKCPIEDAAYDVTPDLSVLSPDGDACTGKVLLIPSSIEPGEIAKVLRQGYDVSRLNDGIQSLTSVLELDVLLIDTHPGVNEETLLSIAISDALVLIMRPDHQDYQGTAVTVDLAKRLDVPKMLIVVNKVPPRMDHEQLRADVQKAYGVPVHGLLPLSEDMVHMASRDLFTVCYPDHELTGLLRSVATNLMA